MSEYNQKNDSSAMDIIRDEMINNLKEEAKNIGADISSCGTDIPCIKQKINEQKSKNEISKNNIRKQK